LYALEMIFRYYTSTYELMRVSELGGEIFITHLLDLNLVKPYCEHFAKNRQVPFNRLEVY
jgi:hypothetical protein